MGEERGFISTPHCRCYFPLPPLAAPQFPTSNKTQFPPLPPSSFFYTHTHPSSVEVHQNPKSRALIAFSREGGERGGGREKRENSGNLTPTQQIKDTSFAEQGGDQPQKPECPPASFFFFLPMPQNLIASFESEEGRGGEAQNPGEAPRAQSPTRRRRKKKSPMGNGHDRYRGKVPFVDFVECASFTFPSK